MKRFLLSILLPSLLLFMGGEAAAQLDSRNRTSETVITDGLAQLPAKNSKTFSKLMTEMAGTGAKGMKQLTSMLRPASESDNSKVEYAINGIVNYVSRSDKASLRKPIHDELVNAIATCKDDNNRAFLLTQLNKIAEASDFSFYAGLLSDSALTHAAEAGLSQMPGVEAEVSALIHNATKPDAALAHIAYNRKCKDVEKQLQKWAVSSDKKAAKEAINALSVCGSKASVQTLAASGNRDAYLQLLDNLRQDKVVVSESKKLIKSEEPAMRCAGLRLLLKSDPGNAGKNIMSALKDNCAQYRHTALVNAIPMAGEGITKEISAKFKKLPAASKTDVIRWLGDNHVASESDLICSAMGDSDLTLSKAAIEAASKIGGQQSLESLLALLALDNDKSKEAQKALVSFNGKINVGVERCLDSTNPSTLKSALELASIRRMHNVYPKVVALTKSSDAAVSAAAYSALAGVVSVSDFSALCDMLRTSKGDVTGKLQNAAKNAISSLSPDKQYSAVAAEMGKGGEASLYYPLLAQAGTSASIADLLKSLGSSDGEAALSALLEVSDPAVAPTLYDVASTVKGSDKDRVLKRYIKLVKNSKPSPEAAYHLYSRVLDLNPGDAVRKQVIKELGKVPTLPAAMLAAQNIKDPTVAFEAASALSDIVNKNASLRQGDMMKNAVKSTVPVFQAKKDKGDADAGYSIDRVNGFFLTWKEDDGFVTLQDSDKKGLSLPGSQENFELYFEFMPEGKTTLTLRDMPLVTWGKDSVHYAADNTSLPLDKGWNTVRVKMRDDRISLDVNGNPLVVNEMITVVPGTSAKAPVKGAVKTNGNSGIRRIYYNVLPSTPVYTLSPEEKAQGFELLFDGRTLENFHGNTTAYVPQDGNIYVSAEYGGSGNLYTKKNYSDFIFRFEFYFDVPAVNNGIGIRTGKDVTGLDAAYHGMEIQVLDHDDPVYQGKPFGYKGLHPYQDHGGVYGVVIPKHVDFGPIRQWHTEEIKAVGDHITVTVDGQVITDVNVRDAVQGHNVAPDGGKKNPYTLDHKNHPGLFNKEGYISFCGHGPGVMFRNVRVLDLSDKAQKTRNKNKKNKK